MTGSVKPRWAEYEALAHRIVEELEPLAKVTYNDHILGMESERQRQIDISVRYTHNDVENLMIIQVKDYKRKADVNTVGQFKSALEDVGAQKGVLICSGGYSKAALTYARNIGILLWSLADAKSRHWTLELTVPVLWNKLLPVVHLSAKFSASSLTKSIKLRRDGRIDLWTIDGTEFVLTREFEALWTSGDLEFTSDVKHIFPISEQLFIEAVQEDGSFEKLPIDLAVTYEVKSQSYLAQLSPIDYRGIVDHLDARAFIPSCINLDIPSLDDEIWVRIPDPSRIAVNIAGSFLTMDDSRIENPLWITGQPQKIDDLTECSKLK